MIFKVHRVVGDSMSPTINDGDYALIISILNKPYQIGDVVIVNHRAFQTIIKRISNIRQNGDVLLEGDNSKSTPSDRIGWQPKESIIGKVNFHIPRSKN